jgi:hypothetical protein
MERRGKISKKIPNFTIFHVSFPKKSHYACAPEDGFVMDYERGKSFCILLELGVKARATEEVLTIILHHIKAHKVLFPPEPMWLENENF